jgi:hypothetical protein
MISSRWRANGANVCGPRTGPTGGSERKVEERRIEECLTSAPAAAGNLRALAQGVGGDNEGAVGESNARREGGRIPFAGRGCRWREAHANTLRY